MLRHALYLARKDLAHRFRARETWIWAFVLPVVFFYFIGTVTGGFGRPTDGREWIAVWAPPDAGFLADQLIRRLEEAKYTVARVKIPDALGRYARSLEIPAGFTAAVLAGKPVELRFTRRGAGQDADYDKTRVGRTVYTVLADLIVAGTSAQKPGPEDFAALAARPRALTLKVESAGQRQRIPTGFEQAVPGTMVMFIMMVLFTSGGVLLVTERNQGILRRLAATPLSRGAVVLGKWGAQMGLAAIQIAFAMLVGTLLFRVDWGRYLPVVCLAVLAYAALAGALGILLANLARTEGQVVALGVVITNVLAALGGCWWPVEITPRWVQKLSVLLPTGLTMDALHQLVSFGAGPGAVLPHLIVLTIAALAAGWAAARTFRYQ
jgi:ABC-type Na+ efflux pump permease subunit